MREEAELAEKSLSDRGPHIKRSDYRGKSQSPDSKSPGNEPERSARRAQIGAAGPSLIPSWLSCPCVSAAGREGQRGGRIDATRSPVTRSDGPAGVLMHAAVAGLRRTIRDYRRLGSVHKRRRPEGSLVGVLRPCGPQGLDFPRNDRVGLGVERSSPRQPSQAGQRS
jgi:hypothetical protein